MSRAPSSGAMHPAPPATAAPAAPTNLTPSQALAEISALMSIEHPWGPFLRRDIQDVLARVTPDGDILDRISSAARRVATDPADLSQQAVARWRVERSGALTDILTILTKAGR